MALMESGMVPLGTPCPDFALPGVDGRTWKHTEFRSPALLVVFMCNHCPYVQAVDDRINVLAQDFQGRCEVVAISANDAEHYPEDSFEAMGRRAEEKGYRFRYLYDGSQEVARAFGALCTPDFFLYGPDRRLAYRGRLDDNWKEPAKVKRQELRQAIEAVLAGRAPASVQKASMGCSIKWKA